MFAIRCAFCYVALEICVFTDKISVEFHFNYKKMFLILTSSGLIKNAMLGILVFDTSTYTYEGLGVHVEHAIGPD